MVAKGEIAHFKPFLILQQCLQCCNCVKTLLKVQNDLTLYRMLFDASATNNFVAKVVLVMRNIYFCHNVYNSYIFIYRYLFIFLSSLFSKSSAVDLLKYGKRLTLSHLRMNFYAFTEDDF